MTPMARSSRRARGRAVVSSSRRGRPCIVEEVLPAVPQRLAHVLALGRTAPARRGGDGPGVGGESDQQRVVPVALADELPDVELPTLCRLRRAGIADVRVVLPDRDLGRSGGPFEMRGELLERLGHVAVAQVPALRPAAERGAVVALGIDHQARVLLRVEPTVVLLEPAFAERLARGQLAELHELLDGRPLARLDAADACLVGVDLRIAAEVVEARVALAGALGGLRVDVVEIVEDGLDGGVEAVEVQAVEPGLRASCRQRVVPVAQPPDELDDLGVAPHPRREAPEVAQRLLGAAVVAEAPHVAVHAVGVGPVAPRPRRRCSRARRSGAS